MRNNVFSASVCCFFLTQHKPCKSNLSAATSILSVVLSQLQLCAYMQVNFQAILYHNELHLNFKQTFELCSLNCCNRRK